MLDAGGLFTLILNVKSIAEIEKFCENLNRFLVAVSWGGHESLVFPTCAGIRKEDFDPSNENHRMVRVYIGLEDSEPLIADMLQSLDKIK